MKTGSVGIAYQGSVKRGNAINMGRSNKKARMGAYDRRGVWWDQEDIQCFTGGMVLICFGTDKSKIEIVEKRGGA